MLALICIFTLFSLNFLITCSISYIHLTCIIKKHIMIMLFYLYLNKSLLYFHITFICFDICLGFEVLS